MSSEKRFLVDVEMRDMPFPIKALSKADPAGQPTVANISIEARIMQEFEAAWIDRFIRVLHSHREHIGTATLQQNIPDYVKALNASVVKVTFDYPFFVEKRTPVTNERCLVRYNCSYSAKVPSLEGKPRVFFRISVPCITTYPVADEKGSGGLFGQLSTVVIETESQKDVYPEDLVALVDRHALLPVHSYLAPEDQQAVIRRIHSEHKTSVMMVDGIKSELATDRGLSFYAVHCKNYGMLHSYSTVVGTEKNLWVPFSGMEEDEI